MRPHPLSCCCGACLAEIERQLDGSEPYYVRHLIAGLRDAAKREADLLKQLRRANQRVA